MNLIILNDSDDIGSGRYRLVDHRAEHIRSVLNASVGETVEIGLLNGPAGVARIEEVTSEGVVLICGPLEKMADPTPAIDLVCALPRPQTLKRLLATSAMMGVRRLHLVRANRVEKSYFQSPLLMPENYTPYLIEGLSQGKLTRLPEVAIHDRFRVFFEDTLPAQVAAAAEENAAPPIRLLPDPESTRGLDRLFDRDTNSWVLLAVGPEGGWVPFEIELMESVGFRRFTLGRFVLRVEHAVTAALAQLELLRTEERER